MGLKKQRSWEHGSRKVIEFRGIGNFTKKRTKNNLGSQEPSSYFFNPKRNMQKILTLKYMRTPHIPFRVKWTRSMGRPHAEALWSITSWTNQDIIHKPSSEIKAICCLYIKDIIHKPSSEIKAICCLYWDHFLPDGSFYKSLWRWSWFEAIT